MFLHCPSARNSRTKVTLLVKHVRVYFQFNTSVIHHKKPLHAVTWPWELLPLDSNHSYRHDVVLICSGSRGTMSLRHFVFNPSPPKHTHTHIHCCSNLHNYKSSTSTQSLISISASHTQSIKNKEVGVRNCCAHKQKQNWARKGNSTRDKEGGVTKCWRDREDKTEEKQRDHRHERKRSNHRESLPYLWPSQLQPQSM